MKRITVDTLKEVSSSLLFELSEEESKHLLSEFQALTTQMGILDKIQGLDDYEPMAFPFECTTSFLREDEPTTPLRVDEVLANCGSTQDGQIKLPKVVG